MATAKKRSDVDIFLDEFNAKRSDLRLRIEGIETASDATVRIIAQDKIDALIQDYNVLKKTVSEASSFLPSYHSKNAQDSLKTLWAEIDARKEASVPRKRFGFKKQEATIPVVVEVKFDEVDKAIAKSEPQFQVEFHGFRDITNQSLAMESEQVDDEDLQLINLTGCTVDLRGSPSTVHLKDITDCTVNIGPAKTSVFISDCTNCKFNICAQQLRIHTTTASEFYACTTSKAIIEDSTQLRFGAYNYVYEGIEKDFQKAAIVKESCFSSDVVDFNWLSDKPSPNWSAL